MGVDVRGRTAGGRGGGGVVTLGTGSVQVTPDVVIATLGAHLWGPDVQQALARAGEALGALRAVLLADGCAEADLRTENTNVWREEIGSPGGDAPRTVVHVRLTLRAVIRDVAAAGERVQRALAAAGDAAQLDALALALSDPGEAGRQAREAAFADARAKAEQYAALAGRTLGGVLEIDDAGSDAQPAPRAFRTGADVARSAAFPVDAGQQAVPASVRVHWAWGDGA